MVLDPETVITVVLLGLEPLEEAETRRSGRVPRSSDHHVCGRGWSDLAGVGFSRRHSF
jgi:hypothetical protein